MDLGLTQAAMAAKIGVIEASIWNWETGRTEPELRFLPAILGFLGDDPRPTPQTIGEKLIAYRSGKGWARPKLAAVLIVDPSTLARWERGERQPQRTYRELIDALMAG